MMSAVFRWWPTRVRQMAFPLCLFALLVSLVTHAVPVASAHSYLVRAEPSAGQLLVEAPRVIQLWFSEEPEPRFSQVQLFTTGGSVVQTVPMSVAPEDPRLAVIRLAPLPDGIYTVSWRAVSVVDGHTTAGNFPIGVGIGPETANLASATASDAPSPVATMPQTAIRSLAYLSTSLVAGAIAFGSLVLGPAWDRRQAWLGDASAIPASEISAAFGRLRRIAVAGLAGGTFAALAGAVMQAASSAGTGVWETVARVSDLTSPIPTLLLETRYGQVWGARILGLGLIAVAIASLRHADPFTARGRQRWAVATTFATLWPVTISLNSHSASLPAGITVPVVPLIADWVHLIAAGTWVGGLVALATTVISTRTADRTSSIAFIGAMVGRFSPLALACVLVLALTGAYQSLILVASTVALTGTDHGWGLLLKLGLVAILIGLGAINLIWVRPRLVRRSTDTVSHSATARRQVAVLANVVGIEIVLTMSVLVIVGAMTQLQPARDAWAAKTRGIFREVAAEDLSVRLRVNPGETGYNTFSLGMTTRAGKPVTEARKVALILRMRDHEMGDTELVLTPRPDGTFSAGSGVASMVGTFDIEAVIRQDGRDDIRVPFVVDLDVPPMPTTSFTASSALGKGVPGSPDAYATPIAPAEARALRNPIANTLASAERGRLIYTQSCVTCHGVTGKGDGPSAVAIRPPPADLSTHVSLHTEGELWWWVTNGIAGRPMPAWRDALTDDERWDVVNYMIDEFSPNARRTP